MIKNLRKGKERLTYFLEPSKTEQERVVLDQNLITIVA